MPFPTWVTKYQGNILTKLNISNLSDLKDIDELEYYCGQIKTAFSKKGERQLAFNLVRRLHFYANKSKGEPEGNYVYDAQAFQNAIDGLNKNFQRLTPRLNECLLAIGIKDRNDLQTFIDSSGRWKGKDDPDYQPSWDQWMKHPREYSQDIFEEIISKCDIPPSEWRKLFMEIELFCYKYAEGPGPPTVRWP